MDPFTIRSAMKAALAVVETSPYDGIEALQAVRCLAALAPDPVKPIALVAKDAVLKTISRSSELAYDDVACFAIRRLVTAMDRGFLRVVK